MPEITFAIGQGKVEVRQGDDPPATLIHLVDPEDTVGKKVIWANQWHFSSRVAMVFEDMSAVMIVPEEEYDGYSLNVYVDEESAAEFLDDHINILQSAGIVSYEVCIAWIEFRNKTKKEETRKRELAQLRELKKKYPDVG